MKQFDAKVKTLEVLDRRRLWIVCKGCSPLSEAAPGQFVMFRPKAWDADPLLGRPLSILGVGGDEAEFLVQVTGRGTRLLSELKAGDEVSILGPVGNPFPLPKEGTRTALVAGGVGLPPLLMWAERGARASLKGTHLFYGAATADDLVLLPRLQQLARRGLELTLVTEDGSRGAQGLVVDPLVQLLSETAETSPLRVFTCGPKAMMAAVVDACKRHEVPCWVSLENRMACGRGICLGCALEGPNGEVFLVCEDGPVMRGEEVDWLEGRGRAGSQPRTDPIPTEDRQ